MERRPKTEATVYFNDEAPNDVIVNTLTEHKIDFQLKRTAAVPHEHYHIYVRTTGETAVASIHAEVTITNL